MIYNPNVRVLPTVKEEEEYFYCEIKNSLRRDMMLRTTTKGPHKDDISFDVNGIDMQRERITAIIPVNEFSDDKYLIGVTKNGIIKKTPLSQYDTTRKTGIIAMNLKDDDQLIDIKQTTGTNNVIIVTKHGKCICFSENDVRSMTGQ